MSRAGVAGSTTYDPQSPLASILRGSFNGLSAGLLLYVGFVSLLAEELSRADLMSPAYSRTRLAMFGAMVAGFGGMALLGIVA